MEKTPKTNLHHWSPGKILASSLWGVVLLGLSLLINYQAGVYATNHASNPVNDLILDRIPTYDVVPIFFYGLIPLFALVAILAALRPTRIPFVLKSISLFVLIRSFFIILTHVGPSLQQTPLDNHGLIVNKFTFTGDLFFSGHTGIPFLMALVFWDQKILRWIFLGGSVFFGTVVLLGHLHYSIDVFSAFFITFGIFHLAVRFFERDYHLLRAPKPVGAFSAQKKP
ncbi:hypothetical protein HZA44_04220 [Candidatus Peregrinibacteria bacterium]|nr:hypothetical protein [Candidatus Peregrinibacteria bacterium]